MCDNTYDIVNSVNAQDMKISKNKTNFYIDKPLIVNTKSNIQTPRATLDINGSIYADSLYLPGDIQITNNLLQEIISDITALETSDASQNTRLTTAEGEIDSLQTSDTSQNSRLAALETVDINLQTQIDAVEAVNDAQNTRLDNIESLNTTQNTRLTNIETLNTTQNNRLDSIESLNTTQNTKITALETSDASQNTRLTNIETLNTTQNNRLDSIESVNTTQTNKITALETSDASQNTRLTNIETLNTTQNNRLDSIESVNTTQANKITALETSDASQNTRLTNIENLNTTQNTRLTNLETSDTSQNTRLTNIESLNTTQNTKITNLENKDVDLQNQINLLVAYDNGYSQAITASGSTAQFLGDVKTKTGRFWRQQFGPVGVAGGTGAWFRIAQNGPLISGSGTGGTRAAARFILQETTSSNHGHIEFIASTAFGGKPTLTLLHSTAFSNSFGCIRKIRILDSGTYDGSAVDVYIIGTSAIESIILENEWTTGWTGLNFEANATIPSGFVSHEFDFGNDASFAINRQGNYFVVDGTGKVGIGNQFPVERLHVTGNSFITGYSEIQGHAAIGYKPGESGSSGLYFATPSAYGIPAIQGVTSSFSGNQNIAIAPIGGNVGVGTNDPKEKFHVVGNTRIDGLDLSLRAPAAQTAEIRGTHATATADTELILYQAGTGNAIMQTNASTGNIVFNTNGANERMRILNNGNVGIGTNNPNVPFHVRVGTDQNLRFRSLAGNIQVYAANDTASAYGRLDLDGSPLVINGPTSSGGNVGIGITNPGHKLHVQGGTTRLQNIVIDSNEINSQAVGLYLNHTGATGNILMAGNGGRVGINTTNPGTTLDVNGVATIRDSLFAGYAPGSTDGIAIGNSGTYGICPHIQGITSGFGTNKIAINPVGGNVGIGTNDPIARLQVNSTSTSFNVATGIRLGTATNYATFNYVIPTTGTEYLLIQGTKEGTGNNRNIALNPFGGNVGVGYIFPSYPLDVNGIIRGSEILGIHRKQFMRTAFSGTDIKTLYTSSIGGIPIVPPLREDFMAPNAYGGYDKSPYNVQPNPAFTVDSTRGLIMQPWGSDRNLSGYCRVVLNGTYQTYGIALRPTIIVDGKKLPAAQTYSGLGSIIEAIDDLINGGPSSTPGSTNGSGLQTWEYNNEYIFSMQDINVLLFKVYYNGQSVPDNSGATYNFTVLIEYF